MTDRFLTEVGSLELKVKKGKDLLVPMWRWLSFTECSTCMQSTFQSLFFKVTVEIVLLKHVGKTVRF